MELIAQEGKQGVGLGVENAAGLQGSLAALMDELAHGVIITTTEGRLLHANQAGRHELVRASALVLWQGGLVQACRPECDRELQSAIARAASGRRSLLHLGALEGAGITLTVLPLKPHASEVARCALLLARASVCDPLMLTQFARRYGITPAEQLVLANLCEGRSAPQVAVQLEVAVSTIRSHVRSICAKTRANSVRELVRHVAVLPPVAPAFPHEATH
jgi:DNA-binding CsgD family transcriptional regulator